VAEEQINQTGSHACPHLGLDGDPSTHGVGAMENHFCYVGEPPVQVDTDRQIYYCLASRFELCPRRVLGVPEEIAEPAPPDGADVVAAEAPTLPPPAKRPSRLPVFAGLASALVLLVVLALAVSWNRPAEPARSSAPPESIPVETPAQPPAPSQQPAVAAPSPTPSVLAAMAGPVPNAPPPSPTVLLGTTLPGGSASRPSATPLPPTAQPTVQPAVQPTALTYLVQRGDTLTLISTRFGVPIDDLMSANGITDRNLILSGRTIVVPSPR
jgi:LysM repeat protein